MPPVPLLSRRIVRRQGGGQRIVVGGTVITLNMMVSQLCSLLGNGLWAPAYDAMYVLYRYRACEGLRYRFGLPELIECESGAAPLGDPPGVADTSEQCPVYGGQVIY